MHSQKDEVKKLLFKLSVGLLLLVTFFGSSFFIMYYFGELMPVNNIIERQIKNNDVLLYGTIYGSAQMYYKWQIVIRKAPKIIILGLSRAYQFRSAFFKNKDDVYNASAQFKLPYYKYFVEAIPAGKEPEILIVTLEHFFFNSCAEIEPNSNDFKKDLLQITPFSEKLKTGGVGVQKDILFGNSFFKLLKGRKKGYIGLEAFLNETGTRKDGSYAVNPDDIHSNLYDRFKQVYRNIERSELNYKYCARISTKAVTQVEDLLSYCKSRNIYVLGILPPYPHEVYERMQSMKEKYNYVFEAVNILKPVFDRYSCGLYNFTDLQKTGSSDMETYDGSHGSEKSYARMIIQIAKQDRALSKYVDNAYLLKRLNEARSDFTVFDIDE